MRTKIILFSSFFILFSCLVSQAHDWESQLKIKRYKYGVLLGIERGKYTFISLGGEFQYKKLKLNNAPTLSGLFLASYEFKNNLIDYTLGSWYKRGRTNLSYGINAHMISDFNHYKFGVSPSIGYKLLGFHVLTGYKFTTQTYKIPHNNFYISIRYFLSQSRKTKIKKG